MPDRNPSQTRPSALSRRNAIRTGALTLGSFVFGLGGIGRGAAQDEDGTARELQARIYTNDFYPRARFRILSSPLEYKPEIPIQEGESFLADMYWADYETRIARYANTGERVLFFPRMDAEVTQGDRYRTSQIRSTDQLAEGIATVGFTE